MLYNYTKLISFALLWQLFHRVRKRPKRSQPQSHGWPALFSALTFAQLLHLLLACLCQFYPLSSLVYLSLAYNSFSICLSLGCAPCCCFNPFILLFYFCIKWPQWKVGLLFPSPFKALSSLLCAASFSFIFACGNWPEVSTDWRSTISYHSKWKWHQSQWAERTFPFLSTDLFQYTRVSRTLYFYWSLCYWSHQIGLILLKVCC